MTSFRIRAFLAALGLLLTGRLPAEAQLGAVVPNWTVPAASAAPAESPSARRPGKTTMSDVTLALPFIGVTPCRIVDTRTAAGPFGGPALVAGSARTFNLRNGPCAGIPFGVGAYSLNITATNPQGPGFILAYPASGTQPLVSTLNYVAGQTVANAAIVPADPSSGSITLVAGVSGTDVIIDINGYFAGSLNDGRAMDVFGKIANTSVLTGANFDTGLNWAVFGQSTGAADGAAGVLGEDLSTTGQVWGVEGFSSSNSPGAAGLFGGDSGGPVSILGGSTFPAGVWGASTRGYGVIGVSTVDGVKGVFINGSGTALTAGHLGHDATNGVFASGNVAATGAKTFIEPHPLSAGKAIVYVALEGPEAGTYFRGRGTIRGGTGTIPVPESFRMVTDAEGLTVQITPVGQVANVAVVSADLNTIVVHSNVKELDFYYLVNGVRQAFKDWDPMGQPDYFVPESADSRMPESLSGEQKRRLIANGTYNEDGRVNRETAEKAGWTKAWADRDAAAQSARAAAAQPRPAGRQGP